MHTSRDAERPFRYFLQESLSKRMTSIPICRSASGTVQKTHSTGGMCTFSAQISAGTSHPSPHLAQCSLDMRSTDLVVVVPTLNIASVFRARGPRAPRFRMNWVGLGPSQLPPDAVAAPRQPQVGPQVGRRRAPSHLFLSACSVSGLPPSCGEGPAYHQGGGASSPRAVPRAATDALPGPGHFPAGPRPTLLRPQPAAWSFLHAQRPLHMAAV